MSIPGFDTKTTYRHMVAEGRASLERALACFDAEPSIDAARAVGSEVTSLACAFMFYAAAHSNGPDPLVTALYLRSLNAVATHDHVALEEAVRIANRLMLKINEQQEYGREVGPLNEFFRQ